MTAGGAPPAHPAWGVSVEVVARRGVHREEVGPRLLGHTHLPMIRKVAGRVVVNPGSVGQPRDGDPRASYAVIEDGRPRLGRVEYDIERTVRDLGALKVGVGVTARLISILRTGAG